MKNAILMVAAMGMFGGALAASATPGFPTSNPQTTTVVQPVEATVSNVCTYAVPDTRDTNGYTFRQDPFNITSAVVSNALTPVTNNSMTDGQFFIFRCTAGTMWDSAGYTKDTHIDLDGADGSNSGDKLTVHYVIVPNDVTGGPDGDIHSAKINFDIPGGQWTSSAGKYRKDISVTISYN